MDKNFAKPEGLSEKGELAYKAIMDVLATTFEMFGAEPDSGGCKGFYSPAEWIARGERYGRDAELIIVYDGSDLGMFFNTYDAFYESQDRMREALDKLGLFTEECTNWYAAVYKK